MPPTHPGEIFYEEFLVPLGKSVEDFVNDLKQKGIDVDDQDLAELKLFSEEKCDCRVHLAVILSEGTGTSGNFWLNLQNAYDQKIKQLLQENT